MTRSTTFTPRPEGIASGSPLSPADFGIGALFSTVRDAVIVGDAASGRIVLWSPSAEAIFGYSAAEAVGMLLEALVPVALRERHRLGLAGYAATGRGDLIDAGTPVELPALRHCGTEITVELSLNPVTGVGLPGRYILAIVRDASERKRIEAERLALVREQAGRERLALLADAGRLLGTTLDLEATLEGITDVAVPRLADWCLVDVVEDDGAYRRVVVAHADPARADLAAVLRRYPPEPAGGAGIARTLRTGEAGFLPRVPDDVLETVARDAEHLAALRAIGPFSWMGVPLVARGRTVGAVGFIGVGSRRYTEDDLVMARELCLRAAVAIDNADLYRREREAVAARDQFLAIASHELRSPITAIKGVVDVISHARAAGTVNPARETRLLRLLDEATMRLVVLTGDLLDVTRLRLGRLAMQRAPLDLGAFVERVVGQYRDLLGENHALHCRVGTGLEIAADADRMEQVIRNLLDNAVKYSPAGGTIAITVDPDEDGVRVSVKDQGIGLPPGAAEVVFEPFGRAANATERRLPGLGLGLHICRGIVERHGGRIWADSDGAGLGTTVAFWLPADQVDRAVAGR